MLNFREIGNYRQRPRVLHRHGDALRFDFDAALGNGRHPSIFDRDRFVSLLAGPRRLNGSGLLEKYPNLSAYVARGEARAAYKRAVEDQLAGFHWQATDPLMKVSSGLNAVIALRHGLRGCAL